MNTDKLFTLIIPVYDEPIALVDECLMSVCTQQCFDFNHLETIIVVDGNQSKYDELKEFESKYSKLNLSVKLNEVNGGAGVARNLGIDSANGMYIIFADCDDVYNNNLAFASMYKAVTENLEFPDYMWTKFFEESVDTDQSGNAISRKLVLHSDPIVWSFAKVIKREVLDRYRIRFAPDIRIYEDTHFCAMAYALSSTAKHIDDVSYFWRWRSNSTIRKNAQIKKFVWTKDLMITNLYLIDFLERVLDKELDNLNADQITRINEVLAVKSKLIVDAYSAEQVCKAEQPNLLRKVEAISDSFRSDILKNAMNRDAEIESRLDTLPRYRESFYEWMDRRGFNYTKEGIK